MSANSAALATSHAFDDRAGFAGTTASDVTGGLIEWISQAAPDMPIKVLGGAKTDVASGIVIRLNGLAPRVVPAAPGRTSKMLALDYLVTVNLDNPLAEQTLVAELAFAALGRPEIELVTAISAAALCHSLGLPPAQGLVFRTELRRDAVLPAAPLVRQPPITQLEPLSQAEGVVVGPGGVPIANALVMLKGSNRSVTTGPDGRFCFAIPAGTPAKVTARARMRQVSASLNSGATTVLNLPLEA